MRGKVQYAPNGDAICEMCGQSFRRVLNHVSQIHKISAQEYRKRFGLNRSQPVCNQELSKRMSEVILADPLLIKRNLLKLGAESKIQPGQKLRKGIRSRTQAKDYRKEVIMKDPEMLEKVRANGKKVGDSQLGNKKRWKNHEKYKA